MIKGKWSLVQTYPIYKKLYVRKSIKSSNMAHTNVTWVTFARFWKTFIPATKYIFHHFVTWDKSICGAKRNNCLFLETPTSTIIIIIVIPKVNCVLYTIWISKQTLPHPILDKKRINDAFNNLVLRLISSEFSENKSFAIFNSIFVRDSVVFWSWECPIRS